MRRSPPWLDPGSLEFPDPRQAMDKPNGLLALGGDLAPERIIHAYRLGIFPWYEEPQPILWWSPDPRAVLYPNHFHLSRSLKKTINSGCFTASIDRCFDDVIDHCCRIRQHSEGTWLTAAMLDAYKTLHLLGYAHSVEIFQDGKLVGGLYGLALGEVFFGESMFSLCADASKVALYLLCRELQARGFYMIDCQVSSEHLYSLGASDMPRSHFLKRLGEHAQPPDPMGPWSTADSLAALTTRI